MDRVAIIFTPFSTKEKLTELILNDIKEIVPLSVCFIGSVKLEESDICVLYPSLTDIPALQMIVNCLISGVSKFVLIAGGNLHSVIKDIKGKFRYENGIATASGLRLKYQRQKEMFEFFFHTTDSNAETDEIGTRLFGKSYIRTLNNFGFI
jgi:hypothetical protein